MCNVIKCSLTVYKYLLLYLDFQVLLYKNPGQGQWLTLILKNICTFYSLHFQKGLVTLVLMPFAFLAVLKTLLPTQNLVLDRLGMRLKIKLIFWSV